MALIISEEQLSEKDPSKRKELAQKLLGGLALTTKEVNRFYNLLTEIANEKSDYFYQSSKYFSESMDEFTIAFTKFSLRILLDEISVKTYEERINVSIAVTLLTCYCCGDERYRAITIKSINELPAGKKEQLAESICNSFEELLIAPRWMFERVPLMLEALFSTLLDPNSKLNQALVRPSYSYVLSTIRNFILPVLSLSFEKNQTNSRPKLDPNFKPFLDQLQKYYKYLSTADSKHFSESLILTAALKECNIFHRCPPDPNAALAKGLLEFGINKKNKQPIADDSVSEPQATEVKNPLNTRT